MAVRRSARINLQNAAVSDGPIEAAQAAARPLAAPTPKSKKRKAVTAPKSDDATKHKSKVTKRTEKPTAKTKANAKTLPKLRQPVPCSTNDLLSSLPLEILEMILDKIPDPSSMGKLSRTNKTCYALAAPRLHKRVVVLNAYHWRLKKMIKTLEAHLTIAQKKKLRALGRYGGQARAYPNYTDKHKVPQCASFVRQLIIGSFDAGQENEDVVDRYLIHAFDSWSNLEIVEAGYLTKSIGEKMASIQGLKALCISTYNLGEVAAKSLATISGLQHLSVIAMDRTQLRYDRMFASMVSNSRSTLKTLQVLGTLFTASFFNNWEEKMPVSGGTASHSHDLTSLKSLTLERMTLDTRCIRHLERIINFMGLEELVVNRLAGASGLFFQVLADLATTAPSIRLQKLFLTLSSIESEEEEMSYIQSQQQKRRVDLKCQFLSSFDTLTSLELHNYSGHMDETIASPVIDDKMVQAIIKHKGLKVLRISFGELAIYPRISYLSARPISTFIQNLPHLEEIEFAPEEDEINEIGKALSRAANLRMIICYPHRSQERFPFNPIPGRLILEGILNAFLSWDGEMSHQGEFIWENHFKLTSISVRYQQWDVASDLRKTPKGMRKAKTLTSTDGSRGVMYREVRGLKQPFEVQPGSDPEHAWIDKVARDIDY